MIKGTRKANAVRPAREVAHRVVNRGACSKRQAVHPVVPKRLPVAVKHIAVGREHRIKKTRAADKVLEVDGVLLAPEHRRNAVGFKGAGDLAQLLEHIGVVGGNFATERTRAAPPGGLHQQEINVILAQHRVVVGRGDRHKVRFAV